MFFYLFIYFLIFKKKLINLYLIINTVGFLLIVQIVLGVLTLLYGAQIKFASMHQISSILLVSFSVYFLFINTKNN